MKRPARLVFLIFLVFAALRLVYVFRYPLFNDESIYIRWGQLMVHVPQYRWASIPFHGKQPLAFWLFGLAAFASGNPEIGPRFVSLFFSVISFFSLYAWLATSIGTSIALSSLLLFAVSPLFVHFQSLAMMEGIALCVTIMTLWFLTAYRNSRRIRFLILLGLVVGAGLWIKTTVLTVALLASATLLSDAVRKKPFRLRYIPLPLVPVTVACLTILPLLLRSDIVKVFADTGNFTFSAHELLRFPYRVWIGNAEYALTSFALYAGPLVVCSLIVYVMRYNFRKNAVLWVWTLTLLAIPILISRTMTTRYFLMAAVPLLPLASTGAHDLLCASGRLARYAGIAACGITTVLAILLSVHATWFFWIFPKDSAFESERNYAFHWTSGYASRDAVTFFKNPGDGIRTPSLLTVHDAQGNPSDYVMTVFYRDPRYLVTFLNTKSDLPDLTNVYRNIPIYYIARNSDPHEDLAPYLRAIRTFPTSDRGDYVGVYEVTGPETVSQ